MKDFVGELPIVAHAYKNERDFLDYEFARAKVIELRRLVLPLAERRKRIAEIVLRGRPLERGPLPCVFLQRRAIGRHRLLELRRPALPLAERRKRIAEIVLRPRPVERNPLPRPFLQRRAIGRHGLEEAVAAYRAALEELTQAVAPYQHQVVQGNLDRADELLAQRRNKIATQELGGGHG